jgi:hypothetical protein
MLEEAEVLQDEEWGYPLQTPRIPLPPHQTMIQNLKGGSQRSIGETGGKENNQKRKMKTRPTNFSRPCTIDWSNQ